MIERQNIKPITGTFANMMISDTGIANAGRKEWEQDFRMLNILGIDRLFVIRTEFEQNGCRLSAEDPRSTTWPEDRCLLDMIFRLCDQYGLDLYLGGPVSVTNLHAGDWKKEIDDTRRYYDRTVEKYASHPCFKGIYISLEALPWHFNFLEICTAVLQYIRRNFPEKKTFMSPTFCGLKGDMKSQYTAEEWTDIYGRYFFDHVSGLLDYCAPQDKIAIPECRLGEIGDNGLRHWYEEAGKIFRRNEIEFWSNVETFQRPFPGHGEPPSVFRQADYRTLYMKLAEASPFVSRIVTYEYFSCMSPNSEWGSSSRLLARYMEMIGKDPESIAEVYGISASANCSTRQGL